MNRLDRASGGDVVVRATRNSNEKGPRLHYGGAAQLDTGSIWRLTSCGMSSTWRTWVDRSPKPPRVWPGLALAWRHGSGRRTPVTPTWRPRRCVEVSRQWIRPTNARSPQPHDGPTAYPCPCLRLWWRASCGPRQARARSASLRALLDQIGPEADLIAI